MRSLCTRTPWHLSPQSHNRQASNPQTPTPHPAMLPFPVESSPSRNRNTSNGSSDSEGLPKISTTTSPSSPAQDVCSTSRRYSKPELTTMVSVAVQTSKASLDTESTNVTGLPSKAVNVGCSNVGSSVRPPAPKGSCNHSPGTSPQWVHHCNGENSQPSSDAQSQLPSDVTVMNKQPDGLVAMNVWEHVTSGVAELALHRHSRRTPSKINAQFQREGSNSRTSRCRLEAHPDKFEARVFVGTPAMLPDAELRRNSH